MSHNSQMDCFYCLLIFKCIFFYMSSLHHPQVRMNLQLYLPNLLKITLPGASIAIRYVCILNAAFISLLEATTYKYKNSKLPILDLEFFK